MHTRPPGVQNLSNFLSTLILLQLCSIKIKVYERHIRKITNQGKTVTSQSLESTYAVLKFHVTVVNFIAYVQKPLSNHVKYMLLEYPRRKVRKNKDKKLRIYK